MLNFFDYTASIQAKLYLFILGAVYNRSDADELFQETAVVLWGRFDKYREDSCFCAWAISIAKNKVLEYLRKNGQGEEDF
ncbi:MAG: hypothetical protein ISS71_07515 [Phycisphaerae bacterium]|nr:hypothetical protein [Phycisphaerae bacterium]